MIHSMHTTKEATLERSIRQFFEANPDEELTVDDMAVKFDKSRTTVYRVVKMLHQDGYLGNVGNVRRGCFKRAQ